MVFDMREYSNMLDNLNIRIIYSGPMWEDGIKGIAEMVRTHLSKEESSNLAVKNVFSVFIEQVTNVLMHSTDKIIYKIPGKETAEVPKGTLVLGQKDNIYFIQTGNLITAGSMEYIKNKIDYLNSLDKKELRKYHRERLHEENDNPDSKGAGLGLIEVARRITAPIIYSFDDITDRSAYLSLYVEIDRENREV